MEITTIVTGFGGTDAPAMETAFALGAALRLRPRSAAVEPNPAFAPKPAPDLDTTPPRTS